MFFAVMAQLGNSSGSFVAELIIKNFGYHFCFMGSFLIGLIAIGLMSFVKINRHASSSASFETLATPKKPTELEKVGLQNVEMKKTAHPRESVAAKVSYLSAICRREYVGGFVLILVLGGGFGTILQFISPYLDYLHKAALSSWRIPTSYFIPPALITVALSRIFLSRFTDRLGRKLVILTNFPLFILIVIAITFIRGGFTALLVAIFFGIAYGLLFPALNALVLSQTEARHRGKVSGVLVMLFDSAFFGFAFMAGPIAYRVGYIYMFYALAAILLLGFLIFALFEEVLKVGQKNNDSVLSNQPRQ